VVCPVVRLCHLGEYPSAAVENARQAIALMASEGVIIDTSPCRPVGGSSRGLRLYADEP